MQKRSRWVAGGAALALAGLVAAVVPSDPPPSHITVQAGEGWASFAKRCNTTQSAMKLANQAEAQLAVIHPGQVLHCPTAPIPATTTSAAPTTSSIPAATTTVPAPPTTLSPSQIAPFLEPRSVPPTGQEPAFRLLCKWSHNSYDDAIIYPGQPGASHLHSYFGNTGANAFSTYASLRNTGQSTCQGDKLNRSAYWAPAIVLPDGRVVNPSTAVVYYKTDKVTSDIIEDLPEELRYIAGADPNGVLTDFQLYGSNDVAFRYRPSWKCVAANGTESTPRSTIPTVCVAGSKVSGQVQFPWCWDGRLDSANHRAHVIFPPGHDQVCPATHPRVLPRFTFTVEWPVLAGDDVSTWRLSSDSMPGMTHAPGTTLHADWFGAWEPSIARTWAQECLREQRSGSGADFCNGTGGKAPVPWPDAPHLVAAPPKG